ncbi:hypothetical protein [Weissella tructae]|uniref:hypothetical protein n=1 Tax=Weissella tructae TaxID=887702 RepID=UPI001BDCC428|nr:hypothetical protein [Weissella tructae]QVV90840.1 hypothetical protein KHQ32_04190 [Weissella tructae]
MTFDLFEELMTKSKNVILPAVTLFNALNKLRETYAKPVEMTQAQYDQFMVFREISWFSVFMHKQGAQEVPAFSEFISKEREQELMRAWLHPELIKVVE